MIFTEHVISEPAWLVSLMEDVVVPAVHPYGFIGPLGYRWWAPDSPHNYFAGYQVLVFPTPNEICGPCEADGHLCVSGFRLNVSAILQAFAFATDLVWNVPGQSTNDFDGIEFSIQGQFAGKPVWLRIFQLPPHDEPASYILNPVSGEAKVKAC